MAPCVCRYLFEDGLFSLPVRVKDVVIEHPKCKSFETRTAAFRLLTSLCRENYQTSKQLQNLLSTMVRACVACACVLGIPEVFPFVLRPCWRAPTRSIPGGRRRCVCLRMGSHRCAWRCW